MSKQFILVANESMAHIFSRVSAGDPLHKLHNIDFPEGRFSSHLSSSTSSLKDSGSSECHVHQFAREIAEYLQSSLKDEEYEALLIAASNPLLEELQAELSQNLAEKLKWAHSEDLTGLNTYMLETKLRDLRWIPSGDFRCYRGDGGSRFDSC